jgi:dienelactone hydrolase
MLSVLAVVLAAPVTIPFHSNLESKVPERFRLKDHSFPATIETKYSLDYSQVDVFNVTFPSPVVSAHECNNTVYAEYYRPRGNGPFPAAVVLDILDGRQNVSRGEAVWLAQRGIAALVVYMAYYGPRRPVEGKIRMLMPDIEHSVNAITQTVLDVRRAAAWLVARPEVDAARLGLLGTSLGSMVGGVAAAAEPRFKNVCLLLGGGGLTDAFYDHPKAASFRTANELLGGSKAKLKKLIDPVDPLTYAEQLKGRRLLLIGASRDDVVPPKAMQALWEATGKPQLIWLDATHVGAAWYVVPTMAAVVEQLRR